MKAAVFREIGREPSKLLKIEDIETPKIKPNEVLVRIESTAFSNILNEGNYQLTSPSI